MRQTEAPRGWTGRRVQPGRVSSVSVPSRALRDRRAALEALTEGWRPQLQLSPMTDDINLAGQRMADYRPAGIEGLL